MSSKFIVAPVAYTSSGNIMPFARICEKSQVYIRNLLFPANQEQLRLRLTYKQHRSLLLCMWSLNCLLLN